VNNDLYDQPSLAAIYDVTCGWSEDRDFYLSLATDAKQTILDIGCGTGLLCRSYAAQGNKVVGLDPSAPMLAVAKQKSPSELIRYVQGTAGDTAYVHPALDNAFDLVVMTGHAFQCVTTEQAVVELFNFVQHCLKVGGRFVFESRNPAIDWVSRWHGASSSWDSPMGPFRWSTEVTSHTMAEQAIDTLSYQHQYEFEHQTLTGGDTLRFMSLSMITGLLESAGLTPVCVLGDWSAENFDASASEEMIFQVQLSNSR